MAPGKKGKQVALEDGVAPGEKGKQVALEGEAAPTEGILEELPEPIATLDLGDLDNLPTNYETFIKELRVGAASSKFHFDFTFEGDKDKDRRIPVTPDIDQTPTGAFAFELKDEEVRLLVVCEKYQFWLRGIVTNQGNRYEIDKKEPKIMTRSESLETTGMYPNLLEGETLNTLKIGYQALIAAFNKLARHIKRNAKDHQVAVAVLLVMIFEAVRIKELYDQSLRLLKNFADEEVGLGNKALINSWADTCKHFVTENGDAKDVRVTQSTGTATKKVATSMYLLCGSPLYRWLEENKPTESEAMFPAGEQGTSSSCSK